MSDKITSVVAKETNGNIQITFTIPFPVIKKSQEDTLKEFAETTEVAGFRKGKAPIEKVKEKVPENTLIEHSLSHILPKALGEAIEKNKLQIAVYPKFELIKAKEGEDWQIRGVTCELPKVDLGDYKKIVGGALRASNLWTPEKGKKEEKKTLSPEEKEQIVIKALLENIKLKIPQILIEEEANSRISNLLARLEKLGLALENYLVSTGKKIEDLRADYAKQATEAISLDLILTEISKSEGITVQPQEIDAAVQMSQTGTKEEKEEEINDRKRLVESILKRRKALDFLTNLS